MMIEIDALGPGGTYRPRTRSSIPDVSGEPTVDVGVVPELYVDRTIAALRKASPLPLDERVAALARAGQLFATATLDGRTPAEYERAVSRVAGVPITVVRAATAATAARLAQIHRSLDHARPNGAVRDWRDPLTRTGRAVWARRGDVFAVHASGLHPGAHGLWPEALALGYRVAVRPTRREPLTPHRLVSALRAAGFPDDHVVCLPTETDAADAIVRGSDLAYGGDEVIRRYADDPRVLSQEPGRSKILLTRDADWRDHIDTIADSISHHGGAGCVNATAVLVEGEVAPLAHALAERLAQLPSLPPEDEAAVLPVQPVGAAQALERFVAAKADGAKAWLGAGGIVDELGDGSAVLRPAVHEVERADAPQARTELPFPCVWLAPWDRAAGIAPLRDTLTLTAISTDEALIGRLVDEPSIGNVHVGGHPTYWTDVGMPHDGYLAAFLMRAKTVIRD